MPSLVLLGGPRPQRVELEGYLRREGFEVASFGTGHRALAHLTRLSETAGQRPMVAILSRFLPDIDGLEVLRSLRCDPTHSGMSILLVTAAGEDMERILGLELGADDCLTEPFSFRELLARLRAIARRARTCSTGTEARLCSGPIVLDLPRAEATVSGLPLNLTRQEFELLEHFLRHPGQVLSRQRLLREAWKGRATGGTRTVDIHVQRLRHKLGAAAELIRTHVGAGYQFG